MLDTRPMLLLSDFPDVQRSRLTTLQVNLGYKCNLSCTHCHVAAGPNRIEMMDRQTADLILEYIDYHKIQTLDLTGGAPEMNPHFRYIVTEARRLDAHVIDRCNLTILLEKGHEDLVDFLAENQVEVVASLPCYLEENVDKQRGKGVYDKSIHALLKLNQAGYGKGNEERLLSLVFNPGGPQLPPPQAPLEEAYKKELDARFGIQFDNLYTITNMPISRFGSVLLSKGQFNDYMQLLKSSYSEGNLSSVMCRTMISIDWQGYVFDCDFNQMLDLPLSISDKPRAHLSDILKQDLEGHSIKVANHCYGCTAGQGSSCGGAL
ncbi:MAG: radical SAM protein [Proteobacteria bacterium]|nr:MAG: radical SAM protein [Pseudomonadota bacterium]